MRLRFLKSPLSLLLDVHAVPFSFLRDVHAVPSPVAASASAATSAGGCQAPRGAGTPLCFGAVGGQAHSAIDPIQ